MPRFFASLLLLAAAAQAAQPVNAPLLPLGELKAGQHGEVWTVFRGTEPEPFDVEVTGVVQNALGPGKALILCQLTDPRVQNMGAVAGMSGSPLYIDGKLAGALSYQIQRFETVRYAGFTPAADLAEVQAKTGPTLNAIPVHTAQSRAGSGSHASIESPYRLLQPVFTLSGLSPQVSDLLMPQLTALGINATSLGGSIGAAGDSTSSTATPPAPLHPGGAVSVALATGDITLAGTGTVSRLDGDHVTAFGHSMMSLGEIELPLCSADIVAILPSTMQSFKVANTGPVIGTISQDRLSAVSGTLGHGPAMIDVEVNVSPLRSDHRTLHFAVARQQQLTPMLVAAGVTQAILGANDSGLANGFRVRSDISFPAAAALTTETLYPGPQGFQQGLNEFVSGLASNLQNPYEKTFPDHVKFTVEPLDENPMVVVDQFQLSRGVARVGDTVHLSIAWRDWQGETHQDQTDLAIDPAWAGRTLEVVLAPGRSLDELTGHPRSISASSLRSFDAYLAALSDDRATDGLFLAVVEKTELFSDQTATTPDAPGSIERIARGADEARFQKRDALLPLWERHVLEGKLSSVVVRRTLRIVE